MQGRSLPLLLLAALFSACDTDATTPPTKEPTPAHAAVFNASVSGTITGRVLWSGDLPRVPLFLAPFRPIGEKTDGVKRSWANPNLPVVDEKSKGVKDAVVFLRGIDAATARPWDHAPVRVEFRDDEMVVVQGDYAGRRGFVHRGDAIEVVSKQADFQALQVRGAAFFTLTLPDAEQLRSRRLEQLGVVELSSGVGRFWMRGHLFVNDHPYYACTDAEGRFTLPLVPVGKYQLVCWHPNWHEDVREHDADVYYISRLTFRPAAELVQEIEVRRGQASAATFELSLGKFAH